ncbi:hypothetical protein F9279_00430 [Bacillus sp. B1-b2]|nr:hypothetical protein F9279_00430 [Bacillus sp. B1-b2]
MEIYIQSNYWGTRVMFMAIYEIMEMVKRKITEKTSHTYLQKHLSNPILDDNKLLLTVTLLSEAKLNKTDIITYATTITLIQIALDTHELITNERMHSGNETKRQLTVLAGDLYSGQYYKILAEIEDLKMLKNLAEGIKEVNESKIYFYQENTTDSSQLMSSLINIEASLLRKVTNYFHLEEWNGFLEDYLLLNRIELEREQFKNTGKSVMVDAFVQYEEIKQETTNGYLYILDKYAKWAYMQLEKTMIKLPTLNLQLKESINQLLFGSRQQQMYVEEG